MKKAMVERRCANRRMVLDRRAETRVGDMTPTGMLVPSAIVSSFTWQHDGMRRHCRQGVEI
jgi:hypothetical protein